MYRDFSTEKNTDIHSVLAPFFSFLGDPDKEIGYPNKEIYDLIHGYHWNELFSRKDWKPFLETFIRMNIMSGGISPHLRILQWNFSEVQILIDGLNSAHLFFIAYF